MAALGEVPFGRYYGSVDATPLFVMLAAAYLRRTGDRRLPAHAGAARRARARLDRTRRRPRRRRLRRVRAPTDERAGPAGLEGLARLGLSRRRHAGRGADRAVRGAGLRLRRARRRPPRSPTALGPSGARPRRYLRKARGAARRASRRRSGTRSWGRYVLALDGHKRPCRVRSSNAGHALWTGIADPAQRAPGGRDADERGELLRLGHPHLAASRGALQPDVVSQRLGLAARQRAHRGRLRALRLPRPGGCGCSKAMLARQRDASTCTGCPSCSAGSRAARARGRRSIRSPARRRPGRRAAVFMLLGSALGLSHRRRARARSSSVTRCCRPPSATLRITGLAGGRAARIDLLLENHPHDVGVTVLRREGDVSVVVVK